MNVNKGLLGAVKAVETLMEVLSALVMRDIKHIMMIQLFVLVCQQLHIILSCLTCIYFRY